MAAPPRGKMDNYTRGGSHARRHLRFVDSGRFRDPVCWLGRGARPCVLHAGADAWRAQQLLIRQHGTMSGLSIGEGRKELYRQPLLRAPCTVVRRARWWLPQPYGRRILREVAMGRASSHPGHVPVGVRPSPAKPNRCALKALEPPREGRGNHCLIGFRQLSNCKLPDRVVSVRSAHTDASFLHGKAEPTDRLSYCCGRNRGSDLGDHGRTASHTSRSWFGAKATQPLIRNLDAGVQMGSSLKAASIV